MPKLFWDCLGILLIGVSLSILFQNCGFYWFGMGVMVGRVWGNLDEK